VPGIRFLKVLIKVCSALTASLFLSVAFAAQAQTADVVATYKDENGWKLQVNGEDYYVKGVVWSYSPRNQNYTYNLWGESDDFIRKVLDYEFGLMKAAGINTIRSFEMIPPEWITYIYREHGIRTVVNPLMGRYGHSIAGAWTSNPDYSDELTRATLKKDMLEYVNQYKNTPGLLMFAFGNESNYGLSWSSFEIENLPEGEENTARARHLYSLFNEVLEAGKSIAPNYPFTIVNGDIQYIDLIAELMPDLDLLGINAYRGKSFTGLWADVDEKLDLPILFFEFGSDAFNAREFAEDQVAQAVLLRDQWKEMYNKAAGNSEEGNSVGGFVFEWRDEWWKYLQTENLDIQDKNASWSNQAYLFDWAEGKNNMNEEWFGITALGLPNSDGVYTARPRAAYYVLSEIWHLNPYMIKKSALNQAIDNLNMDYYALKGEVTMAEAIPVELRQTEEGWQLLRGGEPYFIRGAGGGASLELLAASGANSIRIWGAEDIGARLDAAHALGLSATVGIWLGHERQGFDYNDEAQVSEQFERARQAVLRYKDHPAVLLWGVGNEMEGYESGDSPAVWTAVNDIAAMIKQIDPHHPTMTVTAELGGGRIESVHQRSPAIDIHGINSYGGAPSLPRRLREGGATKPYVITEFGPVGTWEMPKTEWGVPYEQTSAEKAEFYRQSYESSVVGAPGRALGSYAFLWGHKMEGTETWFGMLLADGARLAAVDVMTELWSGAPPENLAPTAQQLIIEGPAQVDPGDEVQISTTVADPEGGAVRVRWVLRPESGDYVTGGDFRPTLPDIEGAIIEGRADGARVLMPEEPGAYRVFLYVYDEAGKAATANIPLLVKGQPRTR